MRKRCWRITNDLDNSLRIKVVKPMMNCDEQLTLLLSREKNANTPTDVLNNKN